MMDASFKNIKDMFKLRHENCSTTIISNKTKVEIKNFPDPLGFNSNSSCLNMFEWVMIIGFMGLLATIPSLFYFLRLSLREMDLITMESTNKDSDVLHFLSDETLSDGFTEFMRGENKHWKPCGDEFGNPTQRPPKMERRLNVIDELIAPADFSDFANAVISPSKKRM